MIPFRTNLIVLGEDTRLIDIYEITKKIPNIRKIVYSKHCSNSFKEGLQCFWKEKRLIEYTFSKTYNDLIDLNLLFIDLRKNGLRRCLLLKENESLVSNKVLDGWKTSFCGHLLHLNHCGSMTWQIREFDLLSDWSFTDQTYKRPQLLLNERSQLGKIVGDYSWYSGLKISKQVHLVNQDKGLCPYDYFLRAGQHLVRGNITLALNDFYKRLQIEPYQNEINARCHLGIAICQKLNHSSWDIIFKHLKKSLYIQPHSNLESVYFLLRWGLEMNKAYSVLDFLRKQNIDVYEMNPNDNHVLAHDLITYQYMCLLSYIELNLEVGNINDAIQACQLVVLNDKLDNWIHLETNQYIERLSYQKKKIQILEKEMQAKRNLDENIIMNIQKEKRVNLFLSKNHENRNYILDNLVYCHQNNKYLYEFRKYTDWIVIESKTKSHLDMVSFTIWYNDCHKSQLIIKDLEILDYHLGILEKESSFKSCNRIAYLGLDKLEGISVDGKKINELSNELYQFSHLVYFSLNENYIADIKDIILSFRFGVKVIYIGNAILGDLLENLYPTYFYNISNVSDTSLKKLSGRI